jgi:hypothetical protein
MVDYHQTIAICSLNWDLGRNGIDTIQIRNILWSESMGRKFDILAIGNSAFLLDYYGTYRTKC